MSKTKGVILIGLLMFLLAGCATQNDPQDILNAMDEWDLVWISDSSGWDVAPVYAAMVEEDTGKTINLIDNWNSGLSAGEVLTLLGTQRRQDQIAEAEIVVFYANPDASINESHSGDWNCGQTGAATYVNVCDMESFAVYIEDLEAIYALIFELRGDQPIIIRAFDAYSPSINRWREEGTFDICQECWGTYNAAIHQAAATYNIPVAGVAEAWNSPDRDVDPNDLGYTKDGIHPNELGAQIIAEAIRVLGYEPVIAP